MPNDRMLLTGLSRRTFLHGAGAVSVGLGLAGSSPGLAAVTPPIPAMGLSRGELTIGDRTVSYRAEAGETPLLLRSGEIGGTIFSVAYMEENARPRRPITFVWNGGPGSTTYPLRETLAPRIFERAATPRGFDFGYNIDSLIDVTDLVFIDAPGVGYSRVFSEEGQEEFWGIEPDGRAFAQFIRGWLARHDRMDAPLFLLGESYGGTRIGQVARFLAIESARPIYLTGIVFISPSMGGPGGDLSRSGVMGASLSLPTQAATAWYHRKGDYTKRSLKDVAAVAEAYAKGPYLSALRHADTLNSADKNAVAAQIAGFIGLPVEIVLKQDLAVPWSQYRDLLLSNRNARLNEYDSRKWKPKPPRGQVESLIDQADGYDLHAAIKAIIREDLNYHTSAEYERNPEVVGPWDIKPVRSPYVPDILRDLMAADDRLNILMFSGYFDFAVVYEYQLTALLGAGLPQDRLRNRVCASGHGVFDDEHLRSTLVDQTRKFYREVTDAT